MIMTRPPELTAAAALDEALRLAGERRRVLVGVTGPPGAGKSALARWLLTRAEGALPPGTVGYAPMDGFHLDNATLAARGLADRKGAPETFDAAGYVALLESLAAEPDRSWAAPGFDRSRETTVPGAHPVGPEVRLIVTEGNYLLLDVSPWDRVARVCDRIWFVPVSRTVARRRLTARARSGGRTPAAARRWVESNDLVNARLVEPTAARADGVIEPGSWKPPSRRG